MTPFAIATYLVDIIFATAVCISIRGALPELPRPQLIMGVNCPYFGQLNKDSSGSAPGIDIQTALAKIIVYQVVCYGKRGQLRVHVFLPGILL